MKANQLVQKLVSKLFGKNVNAPASDKNAGSVAVGIKPNKKAPATTLIVQVGNWPLHEHWRN
jgi:hypothetical protein